MAEEEQVEPLVLAEGDAAARGRRLTRLKSWRILGLTIFSSFIAAYRSKLLEVIMPPVPLQVLVWGMSGATILGGLYALLLYNDGKMGLLAAFGGVARPGRRLIADTGASIHAVGDIELLQDLELFANPKLVKMANGTVQDVLGFGRIEWGPFSIPKVHLVKGLETSVISISQLDRDHDMHSCFGQGKGEIMLADGTVVGAAILDTSDGMYVLRFLEVPEPAQE